ncbi:MAG: NAD(P)-dependent oxidoreductase [Bacteroidota bacterium]|jgi:D-lactate dehydrogenase
MDVYFYEAFEEEAWAFKSLLGNRLSYEMTDKTIQETDHLNPPARLISIRTQSIIPVEWADKLDGVLSRSTGYDHLKKYLGTIRQPLPCGYLEEYATRAVAEHAILLIMALMRRLPQQMIQFKHFNRDGLTGGECAGRNLLVVGVGRIGNEIVKIGSALGMNVRGVDIVQCHEDVQYIGKEEGIAWADVIICSMNLTNENRGYFSYNLLKHAKPGVLFLNIARGEHAPLADMLRLVQERHLGGLGLDVFEDEPNVAVALRSKHTNTFPAAKVIKELLQHPNVLFTPHNAFNTMEAVQRKSRFSADEVLYFLENKDFRCRVR